MDELEARLGHAFADRHLLDQALTHRSAAPPARRGREPAGYERLEFLGDRVLGLVVAEMLLERFPREAEGALARRHADLVRQETLAEIAIELGLGAQVRLPAIEERSARTNPALLADVCEAIIGALHLDGGIEAARGFVVRHWEERMAAKTAPPKDPKTALQEWAQGRGLALPVYRAVRTEGPPHLPMFTVEVEIAGHPPAEASGGSKRAAETVAAAVLLDRLTGAGA
ncbi:MAG TPA: ribonuclease III [Stellaceae bacterium]|nr:ribonuclease III [Stellaceae bacterium]